MPSTNDYAFLSNRVYFRTPENRTIVPVDSGWVEKQWTRDQALTGFSAGVYQKGNEIVVAYTGTNDRRIADFVFGNIPAATGLYPSDQVWAAMELYLKIARDNPAANITFTGHSLGGGLAAMMSVFFNRPSVVFDAAPFELGARSVVALPLYRAQMAASGYSNAAFEAYWSDIGTLYATREANVSGAYLQGEILDQMRTPQSTIGTYLRESIGQTTASSTDLHSMTLLASMERSTEFADAVRQSPNLLAQIFDSNLYYRDPEASRQENFIDRVYIAQISNATTPLLDRFGTDAKQLTTAGGTTVQKELQKAITVAGLDYYYYRTPASATGLFSTSGGAVHFNLGDIDKELNLLKSPEKLRDALVLVAGDDGDAVKLAAGSIASWHVQSGTGAMTWSGSDDLADMAVGGTTGDNLNGGGGNDALVGLGGTDSLAGGVGNDTLAGGKDNDTLDGGDGGDTYVVAANAGVDTIITSETGDRLMLNGRELNGDGALISDARDIKMWQDRYDPAYPITYNLELYTKKLTVTSASSTVVINDFVDGDVGIFIPKAPKNSASKSSGRDAEIDPQTNTSWRTAIPAPIRRDPLAIDLDGNGIDTVGITATPILFDHNADGIRIGTGWVKANDAWVVLDRDGNGSIDSGRELFGVDTLLSGTPGVDAVYATTGFQALAALNTNGDGLFNAADAAFVQIRLWQDLNQDGINQATELFTLAQKNIASIGLVPSTTSINLSNGNTITGQATVTRTNGTTTQVDSVAVGEDRTASNLTLVNNPFYRTFTTSVPLTAAALSLPDMQGSGVVRDLREAISLGNTQSAALVSAIQAFAAGVNRDAQLGLLDAVLRNWAGTESIADKFNIEPVGQETRRFVVTGSTDSTLPARLAQILPVLEVFNGRTVDESGWSSTTSNVNGATVRTYTLAAPQAASMQASYESLRTSVYEPLVLQTRLKPYLEGITLITDAAGTRFDTTLLGHALDAKKAADERNGVIDSVELIRLAGNTLWSMNFDAVSKLAGWVAALPAASPLRAELTSLGVHMGVGPVNTKRSDIHLGAASAENIGGGDSDDVLRGGAGNDTLTGGSGKDIYIFGKGDGRDTINNYSYDPAAGRFDSLRLGIGVKPSDVTLSRLVDSLVLSLSGGSDAVTVPDFFDNKLKTNNRQPIQQIVFNDGTTWDIAAMMAKVTLGNDGAQILTGYDTDDAINAAGGKDTIDGGGGADTLNGGDGDDRLNGELGNDLLDGGIGKDQVEGGAGDDIVLFGKGDGQDTISSDSDTAAGKLNVLQFKAGVTQNEISVYRDVSSLQVSINGTTDKVTVSDFFRDDDTSNVRNPIQEFRFNDGSILNFPTIKAMATAGNETAQSLSGYTTSDIINAAGGDDYVSGRAGNDSLDGGAGIDRVFGDAGNDMVWGGSGNDLLGGDAGGDTLDGGMGNDTLRGGEGNDVYLFGRGDGKDQLEEVAAVEINVLQLKEGVTPNDVGILYSNPSFQVYLSTFHDYSGATLEVAIKGTADSVVVGSYSTSSDPVVRIQEVRFSDGTTWDYATIKSKSMLGSNSRQVLVGYGTNDIINAADGDDTVYGATGADTLDGGAGQDLVEGGDGDDSLSGGSERDWLFGDAGSDVLDGGAGDDTLYGGQGNDTYLFGKGDGQDTALFDFGIAETPSGEVNTLRFKANVTQEEITVSRAGDDLRLGIAGTLDKLRIPNFFHNNDPLNIKNPIQKIRFNDGSALDFETIKQKSITGDETAQYIKGFTSSSALSGAGGNDTLVGNTGSDTLDGGDGDDSISGTGGNDILFGGAGNDHLDGGSDINTLDGGIGNDVLIGGVGNNIYLFGKSDGQDRIERGYLSIEDQSVGVFNTLQFKAGVLPSDLTLKQAPLNSLEISILGTADQITLVNFYIDDTESPYNPIQQFKFADGSIWNSSAIRTKLFSGTNTSDNLQGTAGHDDISGGLGDDILKGSVGDDTLNGSGGNDSLYGDSGADSLIGGAGNDSFFVDNVSDTVTEFFAEGIDTVHSSVSWMLGVNFENLTLAGNSALNGTGNLLTNTLTGNTYANLLEGGAGNDTSIGGFGADTLVGGDGSDMLDGQGGEDILDGGAGNDTLTGGYENNTYLLGKGEGQDLISSDTVDGSATKLSTLQFKSGVSPSEITVKQVYDSRWALNTAVELSVTGTPDKVTISSSFYDNNNLSSYNPVQQVRFTDGTAWDTTTIQAMAATSVLSGTTLSETLTGSALGDRLYGLDGNDTLVGAGGSDWLDGGTGNDVLMGGAGNDLYVIDSAADVITELTGEGNDTARSSVTWILGAETENLVLTGTLAINGVGNASGNRLIGNTAANRLEGGAGADVMSGGMGNDTYTVDNAIDFIREVVGEGTDTVEASISWTLGDEVENLWLTGAGVLTGTGNVHANMLTGNASDNRINGAAGADTMIGEAGNDTYVVDNGEDTTVELVAGGTDTVEASISWTLSADIENLKLLGTSAFNATGNLLANSLTGNSSDNRLDGRAGADTLSGDSGNDTYVVDNAGDTMIETASSGIDTVEASISWVLGSYIENLVLTGAASLNGTGNALANNLTGNTGINALTGGTGNDSYVVDNIGDTTIELASAGTDTVYSSINWTLGVNLENLVLTEAVAVNGTGNALANQLVGNSAANTVTGLAGNDSLDGAAGADALTGGDGNDTYTGGTGSDTLSDTSTTSNDIYRWGRGEGADILADAGGTDRLDVLTGATEGQIWLRRLGNNLELSVIGTSDSLTINGWYATTANRVESFKLADGQALLASQVQQLVDAMAAFAPPSAGQTTLPANYQTALNPVIAPSWA